MSREKCGCFLMEECGRGGVQEKQLEMREVGGVPWGQTRSLRGADGHKKRWGGES